MAKHSSKDASGRIKFRVIEFELDGSDVTMQDAIKGLANAITGNRAPVKRITSGNGAHATPEDTIDTEAEETTEDEDSTVTEPRPTRTRVKQTVRPPKIVES